MKKRKSLFHPPVMVSKTRVQTGDTVRIALIDGDAEDYILFCQKVSSKKRKGNIVRFIAFRIEEVSGKEKYYAFMSEDPREQLRDQYNQ